MVDFKDKVLSGRTFIDLFAGIGGFRLALESLGARCVFSSEWNEDSQKTYEMNFGEKPQGDITKINEADLPDHDILCAGFPCQAFSISGNRRGFNDTRGTLFFDVARIAKEKKPQVVFMENVKNFIGHDNGNTLEVVRSTMEEIGYDFYWSLLEASDFGVPQARERIYMVCVRKDLGVKFNFPAPFPLKKHVEDFLVGDDIAGDLYRTHPLMSIDKEDNEYGNKPIRLGIIDKGCQGYRIYSTKGTAVTFSAYGGGFFSKTGGYLINGKTRKLHPREVASLMGFPMDYKIHENPNTAYTQFGNSVVVDVIQYIAERIGKVL